MLMFSCRFRILRTVATAAVLCIGLLSITSGAALAHKIYIATTHIIWKEDASTLDVTHILLWHDVETALTVRTEQRFSFDQGNEVSVPLMKEYIADRFILEIDGNKQQLSWVGMAFDNERLNVSFTVELDKAPTKMLVLDGLMTDVFETHKNTVIVEAYGKKWTRHLTRKDVEVNLSLKD